MEPNNKPDEIEHFSSKKIQEFLDHKMFEFITVPVFEKLLETPEILSDFLISWEQKQKSLNKDRVEHAKGGGFSPNTSIEIETANNKANNENAAASSHVQNEDLPGPSHIQNDLPTKDFYLSGECEDEASCVKKNAGVDMLEDSDLEFMQTVLGKNKDEISRNGGSIEQKTGGLETDESNSTNNVESCRPTTSGTTKCGNSRQNESENEGVRNGEHIAEKTETKSINGEEVRNISVTGKVLDKKLDAEGVQGKLQDKNNSDGSSIVSSSRSDGSSNIYESSSREGSSNSSASSSRRTSDSDESSSCNGNLSSISSGRRYSTSDASSNNDDNNNNMKSKEGGGFRMELHSKDGGHDDVPRQDVSSAKVIDEDASDVDAFYRVVAEFTAGESSAFRRVSTKESSGSGDFKDDDFETADDYCTDGDCVETENEDYQDCVDHMSVDAESSQDEMYEETLSGSRRRGRNVVKDHDTYPRKDKSSRYLDVSLNNVPDAADTESDDSSIFLDVTVVENAQSASRQAGPSKNAILQSQLCEDESDKADVSVSTIDRNGSSGIMTHCAGLSGTTTSRAGPPEVNGDRSELPAVGRDQARAPAGYFAQNKSSAGLLHQEETSALPMRQDETPTASLVQEKIPAIPVDQDEIPAVPMDQDEIPAAPIDQENICAILPDQEEIPAVSVNQQEVPAVPSHQEETPAVPISQEEARAVALNQQEIPAVPLNQEEIPAVALSREEIPSVVLDQEESPVVALDHAEILPIPLGQEPVMAANGVEIPVYVVDLPESPASEDGWAEVPDGETSASTSEDTSDTSSDDSIFDRQHAATDPFLESLAARFLSDNAAHELLPQILIPLPELEISDDVPMVHDREERDPDLEEQELTDPLVIRMKDQLLEQRVQNHILTNKIDALLSILRTGTKSEARLLVHLLKDHLLRIKYLVFTDQSCLIPVSREACCFVRDLTQSDFLRLIQFVDKAAIEFASPLAKIKSCEELVRRLDFEASSGLLQKLFLRSISCRLR